MASFAEFLSTLDVDMNRRGKQFERFVKWFLKNDPEWATQVEDVWLWDEYPAAAPMRYEIEVWEMEALKHFFPKVRNPFGHGPGAAPMASLTDHQTNWAIENSMIWIKSLIRRM
jgi:hypothetical protein